MEQLGCSEPAVEDWSRLSPPVEPYIELDKNILNPERGFFTGFDLMEPTGFGRKSFRSQGYTVAAVSIDLSGDIDDYFKGRLEVGFDVAREEGIKLILHLENDGDAKKLEELRSVLNQNKDLLLAWRSDFIDSEGKNRDWRSLIREATGKKAFIETMYSVLPETAIVILKPEIKEAIFRDIFTDREFPPDQQRYGDIDPWVRDSEEKTGHYDKCFPTVEAKDFRGYVLKDSRGVLMGGNVCEKIGCLTANELRRKHFTYLNPSKTVEEWQEGGCYDSIRAFLGYRFILRNFEHSFHSSSTGTITISFSIENVGWTPPFNKRPVYLVLTKKNTRRDILIWRADPRFWEGGKEYLTEEELLIPNTTPEGVYTLSLWLPDPSVRLKEDPRYAIRLANKGLWDEKSGMNVILKGFVVGKPKLLEEEEYAE